MYTIKFRLITGETLTMSKVLPNSIPDIKKMLEKSSGAMHSPKYSIKVEHVMYAEYIPEN